MELKELHLGVLKQLVSSIIKSLSITYQQPWESRDISVKKKLEKFNSIFKSERRKILLIMSGRPTLEPGESMEIILTVTEKYLKDNRVICQSQENVMPT